MSKNTGATPATGEPTGEPATGSGTSNPPATGEPAAPATGAPTGTTPNPADDWAAPTREEWQATQESIRKLENALREERDEQKRQRKEAEKAQMTAEQLAAQEREEFEAQREEWLVDRSAFYLEREITRLTPKLGLVDPDAIARLVDWEKVEWDDKGQPTNAEAIVKTIVTERPYFVSKGGPTPPIPATPTGNNAGAGTDPAARPDLTADELAAAERAGMTPERYSALKNVKNLDDYMKTRGTGTGG